MITPDQIEKRKNLWVSMGIHRSDDGNNLTSSIRKRRMSKHRESHEITAQNNENLGNYLIFLFSK